MKSIKIVFGTVVFLIVMGIAARVSARGVVPTVMPRSSTVIAMVSVNEQRGVAPTVMPVIAGAEVLGASTYRFDRTLSLYSKGEDVRLLQRWLNDNGFSVAKNGPGSKGNETTVYGRATLEAVKKLQTTHGLASDGVFGAATRALVNAK